MGDKVSKYAASGNSPHFGLIGGGEMQTGRRGEGPVMTREVKRREQTVQGKGLRTKRGTRDTNVGEFFQLGFTNQAKINNKNKKKHNQRGRGEAREGREGNASEGFKEKVVGPKADAEQGQGHELKSLRLVRTRSQEIKEDNFRRVGMSVCSKVEASKCTPVSEKLQQKRAEK